MSKVINEINKEDAWKEKYYNRLAVDLKTELSKEDIELLKKFEIKIKNDIYTQYEYDCVKMVLAQYYIEEDIDGNIVPPILELDSIGVTREEYDELLKKFDKIDDKYKFYL